MLNFKISSIFLICFTCFISSAWPSPLHITIDPGHGGTDTGAVRGKAKESEIALKVSLELKHILDSDSNFKTSLTRSTDYMVSLQDRVRIAEAKNTDLFLSIHANSASDKRAKGIEFYFQNHLPPDEESLFLADTENKMLKQQGTEFNPELEPTKKNDVLSIIEDLKRQNKMASSLIFSQSLLSAWNLDYKNESNNIRQAPFYVVSKTHIPSVLVELGFLTNPKEAEKLIDPTYQKQVAAKIYQGIKLYKEKIDKTEPGPLKSRL